MREDGRTDGRMDCENSIGTLHYAALNVPVLAQPAGWSPYRFNPT
jgi:hypothetical protein